MGEMIRRLRLLCVVFFLVPASVQAEELAQTFALSGVACHEGSRSVQMAVLALDGVEQVRVLVHAEVMTVTYDSGKTDSEKIIEAVRNARAGGRSGHYDAVRK
jgi:copper chaperone CopZ